MSCFHFHVIWRHFSWMLVRCWRDVGGSTQTAPTLFANMLAKCWRDVGAVCPGLKHLSHAMWISWKKPVLFTMSMHFSPSRIVFSDPIMASFPDLRGLYVLTKVELTIKHTTMTMVENSQIHIRYPEGWCILVKFEQFLPIKHIFLTVHIVKNPIRWPDLWWNLL